MNKLNEWDSKYGETNEKVQQRVASLEYLMENATLQQIKKIGSVQDQVLEIGCGTGQHSVALKQAFPQWTCVAIDSSSLAIEETKALAQQAQINVEAYVADAAQLPFPDGSFDIVFGDHVLGHIPELERALHECVRVIKPGGYLIVNGANALRPDGWPLYHALTTKKYFRRAFFPWELAEALRKAGLNVRKSYGNLLYLRRGFDLFSKRYLKGMFATKTRVVLMPKSDNAPVPRVNSATKAILPPWLLIEYGLIGQKPI